MNTGGVDGGGHEGGAAQPGDAGAFHKLSGAYTDPRAHELRRRFHALFEAPELPVAVDAIAEDLLGLLVEEEDALECSGLLVPAEMRIVVNASESPARRRFRVAHELGHWVCQVLEGHRAPVYCRSEDVGVGEGRELEREANIFAAELLMPEPAVREVFAGSVDACTEAFGVSGEAMHWRLFLRCATEHRRVPRLGSSAHRPWTLRSTPVRNLIIDRE